MDSQRIRKLLARRLKEIRTERCMTAKDVGDFLGKSEKTVSAWEHERGQPDADMLFRLCELYRIGSFDELFGKNSPKDVLSAEERSLVTVYRSSTSTGQQLLLTTAQAISGNPDMQKDAPGDPEALSS